MAVTVNVEGQLGTVEDKLWNLGIDEDANTESAKDINERLEGALTQLQNRHDTLAKQVEADKKSFFHVGRKKSWARVATTAAAISWIALLASGIWVWRSDEEESSPLRFKLIVKLASGVLTAAMWALWERYSKALEKQAEFNEQYEEQACKLDKPQKLVAKIAEYEELIQQAEKDASPLDNEAVAAKINEIIQIHSQLTYRQERFPPRDRLLAGLIYKLPEGNPIRDEYEALHRGITTDGLDQRISRRQAFSLSAASSTLIADDDDDEKLEEDHIRLQRPKLRRQFSPVVFQMPQASPPNANSSLEEDSDEYKDDDFHPLPNPLFESAAFEQGYQGQSYENLDEALEQCGKVYVEDPLEDEQREERFNAFCGRWNLPGIEYTCGGNHIALRCGVIKKDDLRFARQQRLAQRTGSFLVDLSGVPSSNLGVDASLNSAIEI